MVWLRTARCGAFSPQDPAGCRLRRILRLTQVKRFAVSVAVFCSCVPSLRSGALVRPSAPFAQAARASRSAASCPAPQRPTAHRIPRLRQVPTQMGETSTEGLTRKSSKLSGLFNKRNPWHKVQKIMGLKQRNSGDLIVPVVNATLEAHEVLGPTRTAPAPSPTKTTPTPALPQRNGSSIQRDDRPPPVEDFHIVEVYTTKTDQHTAETKTQKVKSLLNSCILQQQRPALCQLHRVLRCKPRARAPCRQLRSLYILRICRWSLSAPSPFWTLGRPLR